MSQPEPQEKQQPLPVAPALSRGLLLRSAGTLAVVILALFTVGLVPRVLRGIRLRDAASAELDAERLPRVDVVRPQPAAGEETLRLPGNVEPLRETSVHARASGYLRSFRVDIGDTVTAGQVLAELETPELDQEQRQAEANLLQAQAGVAQARANLANSRSIKQRYDDLQPSGVASAQEVQQHTTEFAVAEANVGAADAAAASARANVQRLRELKRFALVLAPFAGTVTERTVEVGQLVTAGGAGGLFKVSATDPVRVFLRVPQSLSTAVHAGEQVDISVGEYPGRVFKGVVTRTAGALDPASRTLLTEVQVPNPQRALLPGMYAQATVRLTSPVRTLRLPASALISDAQGVRVAKVAADHRIALLPVLIERDEGATVLISVGVEAGDQIVANPAEGLQQGTLVEVRSPIPHT